MIRALLLDDEELATRRLERMLRETGKVQVVAVCNDPVAALVQARKQPFDVLFLDIQMPGLTGFEFLAKLSLLVDTEPLVVFTTAFNEYALRAFEVNSIDYLVKPIEGDRLARTVQKIERMRGAGEVPAPLDRIVRQLTSALSSPAAAYPERLASKCGDKVEFVELARVTHIFAEDKLTFASAAGKRHILDLSIAELEAKLDPRRFVRIHRSTLVNVAFVHELYTYFGGKMLLRLKDDARTELTVARERVKELKDRLGV